MDDLERRWYAKRGDARSWALAAAHVTMVFGAVYVAAVVGPSPLLVLLWLWFGITLSGLLNLMHECAHRLAFRRRSASDLLGRWIIGPVVIADFDGYRERHWAHHKNLGTAEDTKDAYLVDIRGRGLAGLFLRSLVLHRAVATFLHQTDVARGRRPPTLGAAFARVAVVQVVLLASVMATGQAAHDGVAAGLVAGLLAYGGVYLYGLSSLTVFVATLRAIAEHQDDGGEGLRQGRAALRNFVAGPASRLVFGAYGFAQHATHHRAPGIPHYRLAARTDDLASADPVLAPVRGYLGTLWDLCRSDGTGPVTTAQPLAPAGPTVPGNAPGAGLEPRRGRRPPVR